MLTPFSQRYNSGDAQRPTGEAAMAFGGTIPNGDRMPVMHAVSRPVILDQDGTDQAATCVMAQVSLGPRS
jgi:hypothetical protein